MPKCVYCTKIYDGHKGVTLIMKNGVVNTLCSSKCKKNLLMKRRKVKWISKAKKSKAELREEVLASSAEKQEHKDANAEAESEAPKVEEKKEESTEKKVEETKK